MRGTIFSRSAESPGIPTGDQRTDEGRADRTANTSSTGFGAEPLLSTETIFDTLSSQRRRYALHYLKQQGASVTIRDLSEQVAAWENGLDLEAVTPRERKRVYTALHQTHLPRMDKLGVVHYNRSRGIVSATDELRAFDIYLDIVPQDEVPWGQVYLATAAVALAFCTPLALGLWPFTVVSPAVAALLVSFIFVVLGAVQVVRERGLRLGASEIPRESRLLKK